LSDGAQTFTNTDALRAITFEFATDSNGLILSWIVNVQGGTDGDPRFITTTPAVDIGFQILDDGFGEIDNDPGGWIAEPTLLLMTLTLMALGLVARRFQRVAG
jgi:hypothetical protein